MGIAEHEAEQVERANASGRTPVAFVHGLWLLPSSWDRWAELFEEAGYSAVTPGWPDDPDTVAEAKAHPEVFAHKSVGDVADHLEEVLGRLERKPAVIGRPFGGLLTEILAGRGRSAVSVDIAGEQDHTVPPAIAKASYRKQLKNEGVTEYATVPGRGHALTIDSGWRDVAETALAFVRRHT
jgi:pimeloyl-ACP methyl ester carboxylesterase